MSEDGGSEAEGDIPLAAPVSELPDAGAMEVFWQRCLLLRPKLASYLRAMLPDHHAVDDCLQETYLVMAERYREVAAGDFSPLAFTCARNLARSWLAKQKTGRLSIIDPDLMVKIAEAAAEPMDTSSHSERIEALRGCLGQLKPDDRGLLEARYGEDRTASVVSLAGKTGRNSDSLYKKLERLRALLKQCVTAKLADPNEQG